MPTTIFPLEDQVCTLPGIFTLDHSQNLTHIDWCIHCLWFLLILLILPLLCGWLYSQTRSGHQAGLDGHSTLYPSVVSDLASDGNMTQDRPIRVLPRTYPAGLHFTKSKYKTEPFIQVAIRLWSTGPGKTADWPPGKSLKLIATRSSFFYKVRTLIMTSWKVLTFRSETSLFSFYVDTEPSQPVS